MALKKSEDGLNCRWAAGSLFVVVALLAAVPAVADPLSDLRTVLQRYRARSHFAVTASVVARGDAQDVSGVRGGSTAFDVEDGPSGFTIHVQPASLGAAQSEAENKKRDAENPTPTRTAMVALTIFDLIDAIDAATMLLNDLDRATLIDQTTSVRDGKAATLLRIKVKATLAGTRSRFVKEPIIELRVWIAANGIPIAAERDSNFSASLIIVKGGNIRHERWQFAVAGDRLYAANSDEENRMFVAGKNIVSSRSLSYLPR
jgi:hypothetical protein